MGVRRGLAVLLATFLLVPGARSEDCRLKVAVAASFRPALEELLPEFQSTVHCQVLISSGSSGVLYQQALHGAPFDLFLSADSERPELLEQKGKALSGSRRTYTRGLLALWLPDPGYATGKGPGQGASKDVGTDAGSEAASWLRNWREKIVVADPDVAPFGLAARQVLQSLNIWAGQQSQLVRAHNAGHAFMLLETAHAHLGFVAASQMTVAGRKNFLPVPQHLYQPIEHQLVVLDRSQHPDTALDLADYLVSKVSQRRLEALGYAPATGLRL